VAPFASLFALAGRYPELAAAPGFRAWVARHPATLWSETHPDADGAVTVAVQADSGLELLTARLERHVVRDEAPRHRLAELHAVDLTRLAVSDVQAVRLARRQSGVERAGVRGVQPLVYWTERGPEVQWEVRLRISDEVHALTTQADGPLVPGAVRPVTRRPRVPRVLRAGALRATSRSSLAGEALAANECHHPADWRPVALDWTGGAARAEDKAHRIWAAAQQRLGYNAYLLDARYFTCSDTVTIDELGRYGACDEWSVVQITMLRAVGVPARLKFLRWWQGGQTVDHACVEWRDDAGRWRHMDALYRAFDRRDFYRREIGASDVRVMDADYPRDSRSGGPAWGVPDAPGDQRFHPYLDFVLTPGPQGERRPGYDV
jgi:hypothetical protein